jgi:hypothetical protein
MHRSNLIHMLLAPLFILLFGLVWLWHQNFSERLNLWAGWATVTYGCVAGFWIWLHGLRLSRLIHDIPTCQIATAAQGYVELLGRAAQFEDQQAKSFIGFPVLWYRKEYAVRGDVSFFRAFPFNLFFTPTGTEESRTPFAIEDGTGTACILPHGAEIISGRKEIRYGDNSRVIEEQIVPGDPLYVLGDFSTYTLQPEVDRAAYELTRQWEQNPERRRAFDTDRDGKLNEKEWLEMHAAAGATVIADSVRANPPDSKHLLFKPGDDRPFLISSVSPEILAGRYRAYLLVGLLLFIACGAVSVAVLMGQLLS